MFVAPAVACETSLPPTTPRGTARSGPGFTTLMAASLLRQVELVVHPLAALGGRAVVDLLRAEVVRRGDPFEFDGAGRPRAFDACGDERVGGARAACGGRDEEVVHRREAPGARR